MLQPPCPTGFFMARRWPVVPQSVATKSTLMPILDMASAATSPIAFGTLAVVAVGKEGLHVEREIESDHRYGELRAVPVGDDRIAVLSRGRIGEIVDLSGNH